MSKRVPHIIRVCKGGQGPACCRYLMQVDARWTCAKKNPELKAIIDATPMKAKGDNCAGVADLHQISEAVRHNGNRVLNFVIRKQA